MEKILMKHRITAIDMDSIAEELGVERGVKEPRSTLEPSQYPVDDPGCSAELFQSAVAEPVNVYDE